MNTIAVRWVKSIKTECLNKIISFGFRSLERSINEFATHCNLERPHQETGNKRGLKVHTCPHDELPCHNPER